MKRHLAGLLTAIAALHAEAGSIDQASGGWSTYLNERYGYSIDYPDTLIPQGVSGIGDGQRFVSRAGDAELTVFARACIEGKDDTPTGFLASIGGEERAGRVKLTYKRSGRDFAVASGFEGGKIFYRKLLTTGNWCTHMRLSYPENEKTAYDQATARIAASFRSASPRETTAPSACAITATGVGPISIGMTLQQARRSMAGASFGRASDGDGVALVSVRRDKEDLALLYAGEDDPEADIAWGNRIRSIETQHAGCLTADGIHPGMPVKQAEKIWGKTLEIVQSEIEAREYIRFSRQPSQLLIRLDYTGQFPAGARRTTRYAPDAKILSITVQPK